MMRLRPASYTVLSLLGLMCMALLLTASDAFAQSAGSVGTFSCSGSQAQGSLYTVGASCPTKLEFDHLFSFLVCNMEELSTNLMGNMFCGMVNALTPAVSAVLVLATLFFGLGFTIGVIPATAREFQIFLLKVACVWCFATQADYLIGFGYKMLVGGMRDGVDLVLSGFSTTSDTTTVYQKLDMFLSKIIQFAARYVGVDMSKPDANICQDAMFAVMGVMAIAFPPFAFLAIALLMRITITFLRAIFGYIYAMVGIAFLLTLAPFFLSFKLFKQTESFFNKWVGYLVSFSLQIVILFAFLAFILSINVSHITSSFTDIIMETQVAKEGGSFRAPWEYCTVCDFEAYDPTTNTVIEENKYAEFLGKGKLRCKGSQKTAIEVDTSFSPATDKLNTLMKFTMSGFFALLVLAYILESLLSQVAMLAQILAGGLSGGMYAPQLGGGSNPYSRSTIHMPFDSNIGDFERGLDRGFASKDNSISGLAEGVRGGIRSMVMGTPRADNTVDGGLSNRFKEWLADPANTGDQK